MPQTPENSVYSELLRFLEGRHEVLSGVALIRQVLVRRAGYGHLEVEINWTGTAREWCLDLVGVLARRGQTELAGFLVGLKTALDNPSVDDLDEVGHLSGAVRKLSPGGYQRVFAQAIAHQSTHALLVEMRELFKSSTEVKDIENLPPQPGDPPYMGLQYYDEKDAPLFFGRRKWTGRIIERLREARVLAIVGASGSGKGSVRNQRTESQYDVFASRGTRKSAGV